MMRTLLNIIWRNPVAWYGLGLLLAILVIFAGCGSVPPIIIDDDPPGDEDVNQLPGTKRVGVYWTPPCLGSEPPCGGPWVDYLLELKNGRGEWAFRLATPDTFASLVLQPGTWRARVAARNSTDVVGPFSEESDPIRIVAPQDDDLPDIHDQDNGGNR